MSSNPFEVTKAVDFTDDQIRRNFVTFSSSDPYSIVDPKSVMPQFLVGGKGGGRTHLMRYFAYPLQKLKSQTPLDAIKSDEYLGIYFRCSGLNGSRFSGKKQEDEVWDAVFAFYMDLWLCEQLLEVLHDIQDTQSAWTVVQQRAFIRMLLRGFQDRESAGAAEDEDCDSIEGALNYLVGLRNSMDRAINNAALTGRLDIQILSSPGELIFRACKSASENLVGLEAVSFCFLVDEYENLSESQQRYFNTLIREKVLPACFLIGGREWGIRTHETLSAAEKNRQGSEYEWIVLEEAYKTERTTYVEFCRDLVSARLKDAGFFISDGQTLDTMFGGDRDDRFQSAALLAVMGGVPSRSRNHLQHLEAVVLKSTQDRRLTNRICEKFAFEEYPLLEKLAILKFYQLWSSKRRLSLELADEARAFVLPLLSSTEDDELRYFFGLWKTDMIAQVFWENDRRPPYLGFEKFVDMSGYLPRSLLMILKYVTHWASFFGEKPFQLGTSISQDAQSAGVLDAARWFLSDAKPMGEEGEQCERAIYRLGSLLRMVRYSDKPTEVSLSTFSTNLQHVDPTVLSVINSCVEHRLLLEVKTGRMARNKGSVHRKFQVHPMLAPIFGISTSRRGELSLKPGEVIAIFDPRMDETEYSRVTKKRLASMEAPFSGSTSQEALFDLN